jgi:hypothetical protein
MSVAGVDGVRNWFQTQAKDKARQNMPGTIFPSATSDTTVSAVAPTVASAVASGVTSGSETSTPDAALTPDAAANDPVKEFTDYMKQTPAERLQYAWLKQHGISKS